jgi:hypothetical protein
VEKLALQVDPQSIPAGELVTVPPGLPMTETDSGGESVKVGRIADHPINRIAEFLPWNIDFARQRVAA